MRAKRNTAQKFLDAALRLESRDCIVWPYATQSHGYGVIFIDGKLNYVHRLALQLHVGEAPKDKPHALHEPLVCHNPTCFNYRHLRWGTRQDNAQDRFMDGDDRRGERHPLSKLSKQQVIEIYKDSRPQSTIGADYDIHQGTVADIKKGKTWGWLTSNLRRQDYA